MPDDFRHKLSSYSFSLTLACSILVLKCLFQLFVSVGWFAMEAEELLEQGLCVMGEGELIAERNDLSIFWGSRILDELAGFDVGVLFDSEKKFELIDVPMLRLSGKGKSRSIDMEESWFSSVSSGRI